MHIGFSISIYFHFLVASFSFFWRKLKLQKSCGKKKDALQPRLRQLDVLFECKDQIPHNASANRDKQATDPQLLIPTNIPTCTAVCFLFFFRTNEKKKNRKGREETPLGFGFLGGFFFFGLRMGWSWPGVTTDAAC